MTQEYFEVIVDAKTGEETIRQYNADEITALDQVKVKDLRQARDQALKDDVDPIAGNTLRWNALTAEQQQAWADYRQALLDVPAQDGFPNNVVWPTKPA